MTEFKSYILQAHLKAAQANARPKLLKELANRQLRDCYQYNKTSAKDFK
jgi:hypothetical protein